MGKQEQSDSGFDPARGPQRTHDLILRIGADDEQGLIFALNTLATDLRRGGLSTSCCSGSPSVGWMYSYTHRPEQTHDSYFREIDEWLARDSDGSGEAGQTRSEAEGLDPEGDSAGRQASPEPHRETPQ